MSQSEAWIGDKKVSVVVYGKENRVLSGSFSQHSCYPKKISSAFAGREDVCKIFSR